MSNAANGPTTASTPPKRWTASPPRYQLNRNTSTEPLLSSSRFVSPTRIAVSRSPTFNTGGLAVELRRQLGVADVKAIRAGLGFRTNHFDLISGGKAVRQRPESSQRFLDRSGRVSSSALRATLRGLL